MVTIEHAPPHPPRIVEFEKDCRTRQTVCQEVSCLCVFICNKKNRVYIVVKTHALVDSSKH